MFPIFVLKKLFVSVALKRVLIRLSLAVSYVGPYIFILLALDIIMLFQYRVILNEWWFLYEESSGTLWLIASFFLSRKS